MASRGDAELVRDHCDPNCTHSLVMTEFALAMIDRLQNALWISSSDWICLWFLWHTSAASRQIHTKYIFYFIFYFYLIMFIYHLLKTINWIKGLLEKVCNMLYKYSLSETFREFVLLKCWVFTPLYPTEIPNACLILEKHVRVLFEGNILLPAWLQDLHRVSLTELTLFFSSAGDFSLSFLPASVIHAQVLVFCSEKHRNIHWLFSFLFSLGCILRTNNHLLTQQ